MTERSETIRSPSVRGEELLKKSQFLSFLLAIAKKVSLSKDSGCKALEQNSIVCMSAAAHIMNVKSSSAEETLGSVIEALYKI